MAEASDSSLCKICYSNQSIYVCPRCNIPYCSVDCYKSRDHLDCSESFYKECIEEELKVRDVNPDAKKKMYEILQRNLQEQESLDSDDEGDENEDDEENQDDDNLPDLASRLEGIDLNDADKVWEHLNDKERKEFMELIKSGDATKLVPVWTPWWTQKHPKPKVKFVDEEDNAYLKYCPTVSSEIPDFSSISKIKPSPCVFYNLLNVIASYVLCARYYNGNHRQTALEAATLLIQLSRNLSTNQIYNNLSSAVESAGQEALRNHFILVDEDELNQLRIDVKDILDGPNSEDNLHYTLACLTDLKTLLIKAKQVKKETKVSKGVFSKQFCDATDNCMTYASKDVILKCIKKVEYYLSWTKSHLNDFIIP